MTTEKRQSPRVRRLKEARVVSLGGKMVITCKVRDVSQTGARLKVGESFLIPHRFLGDYSRRDERSPGRAHVGAR